MNWCKFGLHSYVCYHAGIYKSFHKCKNCNKEKTVSGSKDNKLPIEDSVTIFEPIGDINLTEQKLNKANKIHSEIKELESFILTAERVWTGKLISSHYGAISSKEYELNTELKNRMLDILREYREELKQGIENL